MNHELKRKLRARKLDPAYIVCSVVNPSQEFSEDAIKRGVIAPPVHRSFLWMLIGNGTFSLSQWARISVLAKLSSPGIVGEYCLALALVAPIFTFTNLQLSAVQATDARHRYRFCDFAGLRLLSSTLVLLAVGFLTVALHRRDPLAWILTLGLATDSLCEIFGGLQQKHERMDRLGMSLLLRGMLSILAFSAVFFQTRSLVWAAAALPAASFLVLVTWDIPKGKSLLRGAPMLAWSLERLRGLALFALPLGINMLLISLNVNIPRYALAKYSGRSELGIFASLSYVVMAVGLVVNGLGQSVSARLSRYYAEGMLLKFRSLIARLCGAGTLLGLCCLAGAALIGRPLLALLYRPEYAAHLNVFLVLAATSGVSAVASFLGYGITAAHVFRRQLWTMLAVVTTTSAGSLILVPRYHAMGAAFSLLLSALVGVCGAWLVLSCALRAYRTEHDAAHFRPASAR
jgi:O-antigen/teichoic acid export membrane protein